MPTQRIEIKHIDEGWTVVYLANGDVIRAKLVVAAVVNEVDANGISKKLPDGSLQYIC